MPVNCILTLAYEEPVVGIWILKADGVEVYRGLYDAATLQRWKGYWWNGTPWPEIHAAEEALRGKKL